MSKRPSGNEFKKRRLAKQKKDNEVLIASNRITNFIRRTPAVVNPVQIPPAAVDHVEDIVEDIVEDQDSAGGIVIQYLYSRN